MKKNKNTSVGKRVALGAAVGAGVAALGAGAYYMFGPKGKTHQRKVFTVLSKMKKEVQTEVKKAKSATMPLYHKAVDMIAENYSRQYKLHAKDIRAFAGKLKKEAQAISGATVRKVKKLARKIKK